MEYVWGFKMGHSYLDKLEHIVKPTAFELALLNIFKKVIPQMISFLIMLYFYLWLLDAYGFERAVISLLIIIVLVTGRGKNDADIK